MLLLVFLLLTVISGLTVYTADQKHGPLAGLVCSSNLKFWEETHEIIANLTLLLVTIHVFGVIVESNLHKENLVKAMWNGYKKSINESS